MQAYRIGCGYDSHRFGDGSAIVLAGVKIPFTRGIMAHSDGDVVWHALADALLGAAALGDLGQHFSDTDAENKNKKSSEFLQHILNLLRQKNYQIVNIDVTVITEAPKLKDFIKNMCDNTAKVLAMSAAQVNIKAKTNEKMGWIGRGEGLAAQAVVMLLTDNKTSD